MLAIGPLTFAPPVPHRWPEVPARIACTPLGYPFRPSEIWVVRAYPSVQRLRPLVGTCPNNSGVNDHLDAFKLRGGAFDRKETA
jgi:hypothetical protein